MLMNSIAAVSAEFCSVAVLGFCVWGGLMGRGFLFGGLMGIKRRRCKTAIAEGKKPPHDYGVLESVVSSPSEVWGGAPEIEAILNISSENGVHFWILLISHL